jgi:hypothetical protein
MSNDKTLLYVVIAVLALVAAGVSIAYVNERNSAPGLEIRVDKNGIRVDGR